MAGPLVIPIRTLQGTYSVLVGSGLLDHVGTLAVEHVGCDSAIVVSDSNVAPLYLDRVRESLAGAGIAASAFVFPAGEQSKTIDTWRQILSAASEAGLDRDSAVIALGGGVVGDMAGFAAATYLRGIDVVQVPTTLLSMVDSSVGGKTAIDLPQGKNLVGAFHQPSLVVADVSTLATLPDSVFADACGEIIKHAVLASPDLFCALERSPLTSCRGDEELISSVVAQNVQIKRDVVEHDEVEQGLRQTLNLGHTVGHAIEAASAFALGHGSCVAAGLCAVCRYAAAAGLLSHEDAERIQALVSAHGLPTGSSLDPAILAAYALSDKKRHGSTVNLVIPHGIGACGIMPVGTDALANIIERYARG